MRGLERLSVEVAGDRYFFKTDNVHEAPGFGGRLCRSVFCTFIGYSPDDPEVYVWS